MKKSVSSLIEIIGTGSPVVAVVGGMHGNERVGLRVFERIRKSISPTQGTLKLIIANPYALTRNTRYIDLDLNRSFPGNSQGGVEERLAAKLVDTVKDCDYLLDLHSCSVATKPFCIIRTKDGEDQELAKMTGLSHIVIYPRNTQGGGSLIDYARCGIGLELGLHNAAATISAGYYAVKNVLTAFCMIESVERVDLRNKKMIFAITSHIAKPKGIRLNNAIRNFQLVRKGTVLGNVGRKVFKAKEDFYPVLYGEQAYKDILCMVAKKV